MSYDLFEATTGRFIATNGTVGHNGGDSVWIANMNIGGNPFKSKSDFDNEKLKYLKTNNEALIDKLIKRSLNFMNFKIHEI
ncbi:MAG: hypothetical protein COB38_03885 [Gammaproteobacteria bacterium]|nr:MAG: hypothetical protein COB38_03885 [Gammaproteobacteria bacterium]